MAEVKKKCGLIYLKLGIEYRAKSYQYFNEAYEAFKALPVLEELDYLKISECLLNLGRIFFFEEKHDDAENCFNLSIQTLNVLKNIENKYIDKIKDRALFLLQTNALNKLLDIMVSIVKM